MTSSMPATSPLAGGAAGRQSSSVPLTMLPASGALPAGEHERWASYVAAFHADRAGITEDVLETARDSSGLSPYDRLARVVEGFLTARAAPSGRPARVVDLACGSAPVARRLEGHTVLGVDMSAAELALARDRGVSVIRADASRLPLPDASVDAAVMSMALMLVPLRQVLSEVHRVLRPGGVVAATVPHTRPLPVRDRLRYGRLCVALRRAGLAYPNDQDLVLPDERFRAAGLVLQHDTELAFSYDVASTAHAERLLASLYLPDVHPDRMRAARRVVRRWAGSTIGTPIRLLVAVAGPATPADHLPFDAHVLR
jgi:SAM-dependent methyltransferase